jgi:HAMP domain-containing protein
MGGVLLASSLVELYFAYRETQRAIVRVERAKAVAAAGHIEELLKQVELQVRATTRTASDDPDASQTGPARLGFRQGLGAALAEQRELDFVRVLRNVPAVVAMRHVDLTGHEQLRVSRLDPDVVGSGDDHSQKPEFLAAREGKTHWSPVYFKNDWEPYVTLAVPAGKYAVEVTSAEVSLAAVARIVSQIEAGPGGYAYVVDAANHLVAHPDHRVLRSRRDLSDLVQVKAARAEDPGAAGAERVALVTEGLGGGRMLVAHAPIAGLGWMVFVERPAADAYAPLRAPIARSAVIFVLGLGLSILASVLLAQRMVAPIRRLQEGAARMGAGELGHRIALRTGDELEALGDELNRSAGQLSESYANLEQRVEARTRELAAANAGLTEALQELQGLGRGRPGAELEPRPRDRAQHHRHPREPVRPRRRLHGLRVRRGEGRAAAPRDPQSGRGGGRGREAFPHSTWRGRGGAPGGDAATRGDSRHRRGRRLHRAAARRPFTDGQPCAPWGALAPRGPPGGGAHREPQVARALRAGDHRAPHHLRQPVGARHPECAALPRDRREEPRARGRRAGTRASSSPTCHTSCARR